MGWLGIKNTLHLLDQKQLLALPGAQTWTPSPARQRKHQIQRAAYSRVNHKRAAPASDTHTAITMPMMPEVP
eukprot:1160533-Pelagomonas_calceolata.AAC.12